MQFFEYIYLKGSVKFGTLANTYWISVTFQNLKLSVTTKI